MGAEVWLKYEGLNPSGSFKDNGMTAAFTHAGPIHLALNMLALLMFGLGQALPHLMAWRPVSVLLEAAGCVSPLPEVASRIESTRCPSSNASWWC